MAIDALGFLAADEERLAAVSRLVRPRAAQSASGRRRRRDSLPPSSTISPPTSRCSSPSPPAQGLRPRRRDRARATSASADAAGGAILERPARRTRRGALLPRLPRRDRDEAPQRRAARAAARRGSSTATRGGLTIAHVDCDAFYASIEKRDRSGARDKPVIVGGGGRRGVVATCCYVARTFGVRSAMPIGRALQLCPQAVVLPPDMAKYARVGRDIRERMQRLTPLVEPLSIDEAFLDLTGCEGANGARRGAGAGALRPRGRARDRRHRLGRPQLLQVSRQARLRSRQAARLFRHRPRRGASALLAPMSVGRLWGVGKVAEARLERLGLTTIGDLQALDEKAAAARLGDDGRRLWRLAQGIDDAPRDAGSRGQEHFERDDFRDRRRRPRRADPRVALAIATGWRRGCARRGLGGGRRDAEAAHARLPACARRSRVGARVRPRWRRGCSPRRARCSRRSRQARPID